MMARSVESLNEKQWNLICKSVFSGIIRRPLTSGAFTFYYTTREGGDTAPTVKADSNNSLVMFEESNAEEISSDYPIDIYVWPENSDQDSNDVSELILDL